MRDIDVELSEKLIAQKDLKVFIPINQEKKALIQFSIYPSDDRIRDLNSIVWQLEDKHEVKIGYNDIKFDRCVKSWAYGTGRFAKAIIPKGTEYVLNRHLDEIYSENLYITDEIYKTKEKLLTYEEKYDLIKPLLDGFSNNSISCGWLLKSDKTFISPIEYNKSMENDIIGIVGFVKDGIAYVMALQDRLRCFSLDKSYCNKMLYSEKVDYHMKGYNDYNGKLYTKKAKNKLDRHYGFKYCLEYKTKGTKAGDWYLPSFGELCESILRNTTKFNLIKWLILPNISDFSNKYFMSSYEYKENDYIAVSEDYADFYDKPVSSFVRPFLQLKIKTKYICE